MINKLLSGILELLKKLLIWFLSFIDLPNFPDFFDTIMTTIISYISQGMGIIATFVDMDIVRGCLAVFIGLYAFEYAYGVFVWLYRIIRGNY